MIENNDITPHMRTAPHRMVKDGMACPRRCPYNGADRLDVSDYDVLGNRRPDAPLRPGDVVSKEGGVVGNVGNAEYDPFGDGTTPPKNFEVKVGGTQTKEYPLLSQVIDTSNLRQRPGDQPLPVGNDEVPCHDSMRNRMNVELTKRLELGISRYGQPLQPFNGRDFTRDALEEYLDLGVYLDGLIRERERMVLVLKALVAADYAVGDWKVVAREAEGLLRSIGELGDIGDAQASTDEGRSS